MGSFFLKNLPLWYKKIIAGSPQKLPMHISFVLNGSTKQLSSKLKVWINKNETLSKIENSVLSTILIQSSWFFSNIKYPGDGYFDKLSYGFTKNHVCYTVFNSWECLIFYDSDFRITAKISVVVLRLWQSI